MNSFICIPIGRIIEKLDGYLSKNDFLSAERHLVYWLKEAENCNDFLGKLTVLNEQIGLYRKLENEGASFNASKLSLELIDKYNLCDTVTAGTTFINIATAYKAFGKAENALPLYEKAKIIYEKYLNSSDYRLCGLYNNMALTVAELNDIKRAEELFNKALSILSNIKHCEGETAITCCNLADLISQKSGLVDGEREINEYLEKAYSLLNSDTIIPDGNYAYICEKCACVFGYYGFFAYEQELNERAKKIYEWN